MKKHHTKALILGTGGASKAIVFALKKMNIEYDFVSRNPNEYEFSYEELTAEIFAEYTIIINATPVGTHPNVNDCPTLDYSLFTSQTYCLRFSLQSRKKQPFKTSKGPRSYHQNGYEMLVFQAEKAWEIWNK